MLRRQARWILKRTPETLGKSNAEIQEGFPRLAGSAGAQCPSRFARHHHHRAGCDAVWGAGRNRHGTVCSLEGETAAAIPALECGIPSHDTFSRVLRALDPQAFEQTFRTFMAAFAKANGIKLTGVIAVDGKALRGAYERGRSTTPLHMVNVFAAEARMALASRKAPGRNEAKGALDVLCMLSLEGCIVTDALHCNRPFAETVLKRGGHYALALKQN